jgi:serine/threonine protein kinase
MTALPVPDGTLAGYRLVRQLARGSRSDVYLGVGATGAVALKVFHPHTPRQSVEAELDALGRVDSPHLVALIDIANGSGPLPVLVLERLAHGSLATLLVERDYLQGGEAVTLLAPVAGLVAELQDAGVAHGRISARSVHLGPGRKPVLLGLGHCVLSAPGATMAAIDSDPAAGADRDALAALALGVLARVKPVSAGSRVRDLSDWIETAPRQYEFPRELAERLLSCAEPLPIASSSSGPPASTVPARANPPSPRPVPGNALGTDHEVPEQYDPSSPLARLGALLSESPGDQLHRRAVALARGVRPRFWVVAGVIALALLLTVALLPSGKPASSHPLAPDPTETLTVPTPTPPTPTPLPDDPLAAARILLVARAGCIHDLSILCLGTVDEASSAAFASDAALIQQIESGGEIPTSVVPTGALSLVERLGDSALLSLSSDASQPHSANPVSILLIKATGGWRIRDILSGAPATGSPSVP